MRRNAILPLFLLTGSLFACEGPFGITCTTEARASFSITVIDAATGASLAPRALVRVRDGAFEETLETHGGGIYTGVYERAGRYDVFVTHPGYAEWRDTDVRVEAGECHVITRTLIARLTFLTD